MIYFGVYALVVLVVSAQVLSATPLLVWSLAVVGVGMVVGVIERA